MTPRNQQNLIGFARRVGSPALRNKSFSRVTACKTPTFCTAQRDFQRARAAQPETRQHLATSAPKSARAKPSEPRGLQHSAHQRKKSPCKTTQQATAQSASTAWAFRSSRSQYAKHASCVAASTTFGAKPASNASCHRGAHKHHRSPGCNPGKPHWRLGVERSFPAAFENARNSAVSITQTVCDPTSSGPVLQHPSRKKPVIGDVQQIASLSPSTFLACGCRTTPFVEAMRIMRLTPLLFPAETAGLYSRPILGRTHHEPAPRQHPRKPPAKPFPRPGVWYTVWSASPEADATPHDGQTRPRSLSNRLRFSATGSVETLPGHYLFHPGRFFRPGRHCNVI